MKRRVLARMLLVGALFAGVVAMPSPAPAAAPTHYVEMADGTLIAVNVQFPFGASPVGGWPTIIQIDGYGGAPIAMNADSARYGNGKYVTVHMSLRGTGCSGGQFDLFDRRSSEDGRQVIEWIAGQPWSNGKVAIWGHSYSGLTGWLVASTKPPSSRRDVGLGAHRRPVSRHRLHGRRVELRLPADLDRRVPSGVRT